MLRRSMKSVTTLTLLIVAPLTACQKTKPASAPSLAWSAAEPLRTLSNASASSPSTASTPTVTVAASRAVSLSGTPASALPADTSAPHPKEEPAKQASPCETLTFTHAPHPGHQSDEDCSNHSNQLILPAPLVGTILSSTVCLRVNGKPVRHEFVAPQRELRFGPVAGPKDQISVRFCTRPVSCEDPCTPARDEFADALTGVDLNDEGSEAGSGWATSEAAGADAEKQLSARLKNELEGYGALARFSGWRTKGEAVPVSAGCALKPETRVARAKVTKKKTQE